jgi:hypothetical protein
MAAPAQLAQDERVALVLMALKATHLAKVHAAPVVLLSGDAAPIGILGLHIGGQHFTLTFDDARLAALAVRQNFAELDALAFAAGLEAAANLVELMQLKAEVRIMAARLAQTPAAAQ